MRRPGVQIVKFIPITVYATDCTNASVYWPESPSPAPASTPRNTTRISGSVPEARTSTQASAPCPLVGASRKSFTPSSHPCEHVEACRISVASQFARRMALYFISSGICRSRRP